MQNDREHVRAYADFVRFQGESNSAAEPVFDPRKSAAKEEAAAAVESIKRNAPQKKSGLWLPPASAAGNMMNNNTPSASSVSHKNDREKDHRRSPPASNPPSVPKNNRGREMDSLLAEIKAKQKVEEEKKNIKDKLDNASNRDERASLTAELSCKSAALDAWTAGGFVSREDAEKSDPTTIDTTNLYLSILPVTASEDTLCQLFSKYGKIISVKILYPRNDEAEQLRRRTVTSGFVAYEFRREAEAAKAGLEGVEYNGLPLRIGWGKPVTIPKGTQVEIEKVDLSGFEHIYVEPIKTKGQKRIVDRLSKYVVQNGHQFEQLIMEKQGREGDYAFLFEHDSPLNKYYRWRVYSLHQGDNFTVWRTEPFQLQVGGRVWVPPPCPAKEKRAKESNFSNAVAATIPIAKPDHGTSKSYPSAPKHRETGGVFLSDKARDQLEDALRNVSASRNSVCGLMSFCLNHAESAVEIADCLTESLTISTTTWDTKIARLYTVSDILHNSSSGRTKAAWAYRREFEKYLPKIFEHIGACWLGIVDSTLSDEISRRVTRVLKAWDEWSVFVPQFFKGLEASFHQLVLPYRNRLKENPSVLRVKVHELEGQHFSQLEKISRSKGLPCNTSHLESKDGKPLEEVRRDWLLDRLVNYEVYWASRGGVDGEALDDDFDGDPLDKADAGSLDGVSLDGADPFEEEDDWAIILNAADRESDEEVAQDDFDGEPMDEGEDEKLFQNYASESDCVSDEQVPQTASEKASVETPRMSAEEREKMRKVELKVMQYQVELESYGMDKESIEEKCGLKRKRILAEMEREEGRKPKERTKVVEEKRSERPQREDVERRKERDKDKGTVGREKGRKTDKRVSEEKATVKKERREGKEDRREGKEDRGKEERREGKEERREGKEERREGKEERREVKEDRGEGKEEGNKRREKKDSKDEENQRRKEKESLQKDRKVRRTLSPGVGRSRSRRKKKPSSRSR